MRHQTNSAGAFVERGGTLTIRAVHLEVALPESRRDSVLDCASRRSLSICKLLVQKRQRAGAVQNLAKRKLKLRCRRSGLFEIPIIFLFGPYTTYCRCVNFQ